MRCATRLGFVALAAAAMGVPAWGGLDYGACCRNYFEDCIAQVGGTLIDFESLATGENLTTQLPGLTFASITDVYGNPAGPFHVEVSDAYYAYHGNTIVGSPCDPGCTDDGRVAYEVVFDTPQRWVGVERHWRVESITRFYSSSGAMLAEHSNTVSWAPEFVGWVSESEDENDWVVRIEFDGDRYESVRQVGYSDDLMYGRNDISDVPVDPCPIDVDCSRAVDFGDLLEILSAWGPCEGCRADVNDDGVVSFADILVILSEWGPCGT